MLFYVFSHMLLLELSNEEERKQRDMNYSAIVKATHLDGPLRGDSELILKKKKLCDS
jgi:hypothetical protein